MGMPNRHPDYEHAYNAIMSELRNYVQGEEHHLEEIIEVMEKLPLDALASLFDQLKRNLVTWLNMGAITEEQYQRAVKKMEEIICLIWPLG